MMIICDGVNDQKLRRNGVIALRYGRDSPGGASSKIYINKNTKTRTEPVPALITQTETETEKHTHSHTPAR